MNHITYDFRDHWLVISDILLVSGDMLTFIQLVSTIFNVTNPSCFGDGCLEKEVKCR